MEDPRYHLKNVVRVRDDQQDFEGPLNLILMLLSKNKIEIRDLQISDILDQYLAYLAEMQSMDLEIASEFIQMASYLLYIKTKTMLSFDEEPTELELLLQSLEQIKARAALSAVQNVIGDFALAAQKGMLYYVKPPEPWQNPETAYSFHHEPVELLLALAGIYAEGGKKPDIIPRPDSVIPRRIVFSVKDKSRQLIQRLKNGGATMRELYQDCASRSEVVATFISVLEMCSVGNIRLFRRGEEYCLEFVGGDVDEILERIVEQTI